MALYSMKCTVCPWEGDRVCRFDDIPNQKCGNKIKVIDKATIESYSPGQGVRGSVEASHTEKCNGQLARTEEIEVGRSTGNMWKYGTAG